MYPYEEAIESAGKLGMKGVGMISPSEKAMDEYYTPKRVKDLNDLLESYNMQVIEFIIRNPLTASLNGLAFLCSQEQQRLDS